MKKFTFAVLTILLMVVSSSPGWAAFPQEINYQGKLANAGGTPLTGTYSVVFAIYDASSGGNSKWTETQNVTAESGFFNVLLGSVTPIGLDVFDGTDRWLGVKVEADSEMTPRLKLVSAGHAFKANDSDKLGGQLPSYYIGAAGGGSVTLGPIAQQTTAAATAVWVKGATTGVSGEGTTYGVYGTSGDRYGYLGSSTSGVYGSNGGTVTGFLGGNSIGAYGTDSQREGHLGDANWGVFGSDGTRYGALGGALNGVNYGGYAEYDSNNKAFLAGSNFGVSGKGSSYGVSGESTTYPVYGKNTSNSNVGYLGGTDYSVWGAYTGMTDFSECTGYLGSSDTGVYGTIGSSTGAVPAYAVHGNAYGPTSEPRYAVYGKVAASTFGYLGGRIGSNYYGAYAENNTGTRVFLAGGTFGLSVEGGTTYGIQVNGPGKTTTYGIYANNNFNNIGILSCNDAGLALSGVYGSSMNATDWGGYFTGGRGLYASKLQVAYDAANRTYNVIGSGTTSHDFTNSSQLYITSSLEVDGIAYFDGGHSDVAELIIVTGPNEAGDILVVDPDNDEKAARSSGAYQPSVIGVISEKPSLLVAGGLKETEAVPIALCGRVNVKVTSENGAINRGDLLTTSSTPGCAMKATRPGFIIGRAMQNYDGPSGQVGKIKTFVNISWFGGTQ